MDYRPDEQAPDASGSGSSKPPRDSLPIHINTKPSPRCSIHGTTGPVTKEERPQAIARIKAGPLMKQETAATKVQKNFRGHRVRKQFPQWKEQLETVEEEARKKVSFVESPVNTVQRKSDRTYARKSTPFIKKEDLPLEEYGVEIVTHDIGRDDPRWNLRQERKLTGFMRAEDLPAESDTESDSEDHLCEKVVEIVTPEIPRDEPQPRWNLRSQRKLTGFVKKSDLSDESDFDSEV